MIARLTVGIVALAVPLFASAITHVHFDVTCLSREVQDDARAKAKVIMDEAAAKRRELAGVTGPDTYPKAVAERDAKQSALTECSVMSKRAGRSPGEACLREIEELRTAADRANNIYQLTINPERPIDAEERRRLETLRAQYPDCPSKKP